MRLTRVGRALGIFGRERYDVVTVSPDRPRHIVEGLRALEPYGRQGPGRHFFEKQFRLDESERTYIRGDFEKVLIHICRTLENTREQVWGVTRLPVTPNYPRESRTAQFGATPTSHLHNF